MLVDVTMDAAFSFETAVKFIELLLICGVIHGLAEIGCKVILHSRASMLPVSLLMFDTSMKVSCPFTNAEVR